MGMLEKAGVVKRKKCFESKNIPWKRKNFIILTKFRHRYKEKIKTNYKYTETSSIAQPTILINSDFTPEIFRVVTVLLNWRKVLQAIEDEAPDFCFIQENRFKQGHSQYIKGMPHPHKSPCKSNEKGVTVITVEYRPFQLMEKCMAKARRCVLVKGTIGVGLLTLGSIYARYQDWMSVFRKLSQTLEKIKGEDMFIGDYLCYGPQRR